MVDLLKGHGFSNVQLFRFGEREWQKNRAEAEREMSTTQFNLVKATDLLRWQKDNNYRIIDIRSAEEFNKAHIKGAINNPFQMFEMVSASSSPSGLAQKSAEFILPFEQLLKGAKNIVFYSDGIRLKEFTDALRGARRSLPQKTDVKIHFFLGGLSEWQARHEWLPDEGYIIESSK
jgi:rhodanese-related sulfurtransferase